jgi:excisionase family DNA binding protein
MTMPAPLLTVQEAATTSRLSVSTIRRAIRLRQLHVVRPVGRRRLLVSAPALEAFLYGAPGAPIAKEPEKERAASRRTEP